MSIRPYPAPLGEDDVPEHLRHNALVRHLLSLTPDNEAALAALAAEDASDDELVAAEIIASVK